MNHDDVVQLLHVSTQTLLSTHDVASPLMPTNQEFTTQSKENPSNYNDTLFQMHLIEWSTWTSVEDEVRILPTNSCSDESFDVDAHEAFAGLGV